MNMTLDQIMSDYTTGKKTVEETNKALEQIGSPLSIDPEKNVLTEQDKRATTIGYYPDQANGVGLLDTGTGSLDKVEIRNGRLVGCDCGEMPALVFVAGRMYNVQGSVLVD